MRIVSPVLDFIGSNKGLAIIGSALVGSIVFVTMIGCEPKVQIPGRIQTQMKVDAELPLKTARTLLDDFRAQSEENVKRDAADLERLSGSIAEAEAWQANMSAILWGALDTAGESAKALPGMQLILPSLFGLLGLFLPKPGTQKKIDAAYDAGRTDTVQTLASVKVAPSGVA